MTRKAPEGNVWRSMAAAIRLIKVALAACCVAGAFLSPAANAGYSELEPRVKPEAPGPRYVSKSDKDRLLAASAALKARHFPTAVTLIDLVSDPIAKGLGQWMYFMAEDPSVDFNVADSFLDSNPDWPARNRIHAFVEKKIPDTAPADQVLAFFDSRDPVTSAGKLQLARALFAVGDKAGGEQQIRNAWINDTLTLAEEKKIISNYGSRLTKVDHAARVDRLLWGREVTNARRVFPYLDSDDRRKAEARSALLLQAANADNLFDRLPEGDKLDSGVLLAAVRYYRLRGEEQFAMALASMAPDDPNELRDGVRWWNERNLLMRWALKNGRFADAYTVAAGHGMAEGAEYADAEFYAGWIALRFLKAPERAGKHFLALASGVNSPISVSRAQYWLGRAATAEGDNDKAKLHYANAAQHFYSYYGQLAAEEVGGMFAEAKFASVSDSSPADRALFSSRPTVAALRILSDLDLDYEFMVFAYHVDDQLEKPGEYIELAKLTNGEGAPHLTVRAGKVAVQRGAFTPDVAYPLVYIPDEASRYVSPEIILGLSRQESEFNPRAYSSAGARGVMQLIPTTAQITARKEGLVYSRTALLDDPMYNMTIGSAHLSHLIDRFDGSLIMTLAAYNAGASRVDQWVVAYGDPRSDAVDPLDWVELIPFAETRNYVQRVLENVQVYRGRLSEKPIPGRLQADIERGGARNRIASAPAPSLVLARMAASHGSQDLSPLPKRTEDRARRYASENPLHMPGDIGAPLTAPDEAVLSPTPITFSPEPPTIATPEAARSNSLPGKKLEKVLQSPVDRQPVNDMEPVETLTPKSGGTEQAPDIGIGSSLDEISAEMPAVIPDAQQELQNSRPNSDVVSSEFLALPIDDTGGTDAAELISDFPPIAEAMADEFDDLISTETVMDSCLTYREFIANNAEEDAEATDLNAGMLAELQGGGGC